MSALCQPTNGQPGPGPRRWLFHVLATVTLALMAGCHSLNLLTRDRHVGKTDQEATAAKEPCTPGKYSLKVGPAIVFSDRELDRDHPVFQDLAGLRDQVYKELQLPPGSAVVQVYLFESKERYENYMHARHPELPNRRAFFLQNSGRFGGPDELLVYTYWGERIHQDLRHELTHCLLHSVLKDVPLWLDEGLAEYFELPVANAGLNPEHVANLRRDLAQGKKLDLAHLETLTEVKDMKPPQYREAWAWVHLMLHTSPENKSVLINYLRYLRDSKEPPPLGPKLTAVLPSPEEALSRHIAALEGVRPSQPGGRDGAAARTDKWQTAPRGVQ